MAAGDRVRLADGSAPADEPAGSRAAGHRAGDRAQPAAGAPDGSDVPAGSDPADPAGQAGDQDEDSGHDEPDEGGGPEPVLPEPVRQLVVTLAATALGALRDDQVPQALRRIAKFAPNKRARLGGREIAARLTADPRFRRRIASLVAGQLGDLGAAVLAGSHPAAADPVEVAALAYLLRPAGWPGLIAEVSSAVTAEAQSEEVERRVRDAERRVTDADQALSTAQAEIDKLRGEVSEQRAELKTLREEVRALTRELKETQRRERRATELLSTERGRLAKAGTEHDAELRRLRGRIEAAEAALAAARSATREGRAVDDARLWLLLETINGAARGLTRELALEPAERRPADFVADATAELPGGPEPAAARALAADDPARLDQLLAMPTAHLLVDGYNVTKSGYGELSLEQQRNRLVASLAAVAAQTGAEVTCVFDGAERVHGIPAPPRGVRVLFSRKGETADELIRRLVRAEPNGRPVVVISSDREVADGVRRHGAYPLSAHTLLRRLART